jgi:hypothetical protein
LLERGTARCLGADAVGNTLGIHPILEGIAGSVIDDATEVFVTIDHRLQIDREVVRGCIEDSAINRLNFFLFTSPIDEEVGQDTILME